MKFITRIILNRNFILILAVVLGLWQGQYAVFTRDYTFYVLALVMTFSTTGISTRAMFPLKNMVKPMLMGTLLNYGVFGVVIITLAYWFMPSQELFLGFVVIASTPPGVAIIPFSQILGGDEKYSIIGVLGAFIASVVLAPVVVGFFSSVEGEAINSMALLLSMVELVLVPMLISRLLLWEPIRPTVFKIRGKVVDWGFAIIIFTAVGMNRQVFFSNFEVLLSISFVLFITIFGLGTLYQYIAGKVGVTKRIVVTQKLLLTVKSSGFSVVTALTLFGEEAAIPSAVLAVFVLLYLLYLSFKMEYRNHKIKKKLF